MIQKKHKVSMWICLVLLMTCLFFQGTVVSAETPAAEETKLDLSKQPSNWFMMTPLSETWDIYGISLLLEAIPPNRHYPVMVNVYRVLEIDSSEQDLVLEKISAEKIYPKDLNKKRYYSIFFKDNKRFTGGPKDNFVINVTTKSPLFVYLEKDNKNSFNFKFDSVSHKKAGTIKDVQVHQGTTFHWITVPMWGVFAGPVLSDTEKPYHVLLPLVYLLLFASIGIIVLGMVFFGRNLFGNRETLAVLGVISVACLASGLLYFATVSTDFLGGDNLEMQRAQYLYEDVHFPGYPLMLFLGYWFGKLMPVGNFLYKANLFAVFCSSLGIGFFAGAIYLLTKHKTSAVLISLVMATTQTIWNYSVVAQNYSVSILFQCLLLFAIVNLQKHPTYPSFFKLIIFAFLAPIAHMTNAPGALVIMLLATIWYWRTHRFQLFKITKIILSLGVIVIILYSPLLLMKSPRNYPPVISKSADHNLLTFNKNNFRVFLGYIVGNAPQMQSSSGIMDVVRGHGIFTVLKIRFVEYLKVLGFGYSYLAAAIGGAGLLLLLFYM